MFGGLMVTNCQQEWNPRGRFDDWTEWSPWEPPWFNYDNRYRVKMLHKHVNCDQILCQFLVQSLKVLHIPNPIEAHEHFNLCFLNVLLYQF